MAILTITASVVFGISTVVLFYTYAGYPLLVYIVSLIRPRHIRRGDFEPLVTVLITAYNEEKDLRSKLENTLELDYPKEKLEIIVASDCSTDGTDEIALSFAGHGVKLHRQQQRHGKTSAQNAAVELARGDVILFSDATTMYRPNVLRTLMPNFNDPEIGCVAGKLIYVDPADSNIGKGARSYWNYETFLKEAESRACSLIGVSGALYAVRRAAYVPMYPEACSDFLIATKLYEQGLRTVYEPAAICTEETNRQPERELQMRVRVITQTLTDLGRHLYMMNPFRSGFYAVQLFSHKVLRYAVPVWLILLFASSVVLSFTSDWFLLFLALQTVFYGIACLSWLLTRGEKHSALIAMPQYFVLANIASIIAFFGFIRGVRMATWEPIRESSKEN
ncbi:MAG TPA: glycosyltransferase family 2 protein [Pyrinomonadaceae bacterium]|jgi:cellulose synthase/poly-beta-1,6-N-acetylglucosamine synthase-like glycosyltransferase|nr:glycosyltransferase family 2 protein [Pyrinomonadaceae bacterium]